MPRNKLPETCKGCPMGDCGNTQGFMPNPDGTGAVPLMIVGDWLDYKGVETSIPFHPEGESGSLLQRILRSLNLDRKQVVITNLLHCQITNPKRLAKQDRVDTIKHCSQYINAEIARFKPKAILALGALSLKVLTGLGKSKKEGLDYMRGYPLPYVGDGTVPVIGTYHPSLMRSGKTHLLPIVVQDALKALRYAQGKLAWSVDDQFMMLDYNSGGAEELGWLLAKLDVDPTLLLSYDLETKESTTVDEDKYDGLAVGAPILSMQFSTEIGTGLSVRWDKSTIPLIAKIMQTPNPKTGHNSWLFDNIQLDYHGIQINGERRDTMAMWHHLYPDMPANLQFVASCYGMPFPWKHRMSGADGGDGDFVRYGCADVDAVLRIERRIESQMRGITYTNKLNGYTTDLWQGYQEVVANLRTPVLDDMQRCGMPRDMEKVAEVEQYITVTAGTLHEQLQESCPESCKPIQRWTDWPKDLREFVNEWANREENLIRPVGKRGQVLKPRVPTVAVQTMPEELTLKAEELGYQVLGVEPAIKLQKVHEFKPLSSEHLKKVMAAYGVVVPRNVDMSTTTGKDELDKLKKRLWQVAQAEAFGDVSLDVRKATFMQPTGLALEVYKDTALKVHEFLEGVMTLRKLHKASKTYIHGKGWTPNPVTKRVHTTFTFSPATMQLGSRDPNTQNMPKGKNPRDVIGMTLGKMLRQTVKAGEGRAIVEFDYGGCHLVTMGLEARDRDYIRVARIDGHSFLAAHMVATVMRAGRGKELLVDSGAVKLRNQFLASDGVDLTKLPSDALINSELVRQANEKFLNDTEYTLRDVDKWLQLSDTDLTQKLAWVKANFKGLRNDKAKPALLGNQLGLGSAKLYRMNNESFRNEKEAKGVQLLLQRLFPKISAYRQELLTFAQRQGFLVSAFGTIRRFSDITRYNSRTKGLSAGMDAEKAGSFYVQNNAQGILRLAMIKLWELGYNHRCWCFNQVHDSLVFEMLLKDLVECVPAIAKVLQEPCERLADPQVMPEGLWLAVEASVGLNWGDIEEVHMDATNGNKVREWPKLIQEKLDAIY